PRAMERICACAAARKKHLMSLLDAQKRMSIELTELYADMEDVTSAATDMNQVVREVLLDLNPRMEEVRATATVGHLPTLDVRRAQIFHLFRNLVDNALKYRGDAHPHIRISAVQSGHDWIFAVQDNGLGIEPKDWQNIFQFRRPMPMSASATGIGLSICKKIVEKHGGRIWV